MYDVFLSYSRKDKAVARRFVKALRREGLKVWWDTDMGADKWRSKLYEMLDEVAAVVVLWSRASAESEWVLFEAVRADKKLVPVLIEKDAPVPNPVDDVNWRDLSEWDGEGDDVGFRWVFDAVEEEGAADSRTKINRNRDPSTADRLQLLDRIQEDRVDPRLQQGLREAIRVDLGLTETPGAVPQRLREYQRREAGPAEEQPIQGPIREIFEKTAGRRLLILGDPGTGKTNLLLELAQSLIKDAKRDPDQPIPVVFNLPRWTLGKADRKLAEWMREDLAGEYGLSRKVAQALVEQDRILPLFDGLDEVDEKRRADCVDAIHAYQDNREMGRLSPLTVCCRVEEYEGLADLDLGGAIRIEKLSQNDVEQEIRKPGLESVMRALRRDPTLWEVVDTPLWLHVLYGAAQVPAPDVASDSPREHLFGRYFQYAMERDSRGDTEMAQLSHYLGWLAARMRERRQSSFALEGLSLDWLPSRRTRNAVRTTMCLAVGLMGPASLSVFGLNDWLGLVFSLFASLLIGLTLQLLYEWDEDFGYGLELKGGKPIEELEFNVEGFCHGLVAVQGVSLGYGLSSLLGGQFVSLVEWLAVVAVVGVLGGLAFGFQSRPVGARAKPNIGTHRSFRRALLFGSGSAMLIGSAELALRGLAPEESSHAVVVWGSSGIVLLGLAKGGFFALCHYTLRFFLWRIGFAPLNYVGFLSECVDRLFLVRRGGTYEFFHVTFRDYMAEHHDPLRQVSPTQSPD